MTFKHEYGNRKVAIIGSGYVGASIAYALAIKEIAREIVLIDVDRGKSEAEAMDIRHGISGMGFVDVYTGDYCDCADCDMIVITAGRNRKNGETRLDLAEKNVAVLRNVIESLKKYYTRGVILIVANPVDVLTQKAFEWMGLPNGMVFGTGCMLDTSRFIRTIADYTGMHPDVISGHLVGEHGDSQIAVWSHVTVGGISIANFCEEANLLWNDTIRAEITFKTKNMGAEIIRGKGQTHYGIASCVCHLADTILNHKQTLVSVSSPLTGEYGATGVSLSVPSIVGSMGVQRRIYEEWATEEYKEFCKAVEKVKQTIQKIERQC